MEQKLRILITITNKKINHGHLDSFRIYSEKAENGHLKQYIIIISSELLTAT